MATTGSPAARIGAGAAAVAVSVVLAVLPMATHARFADLVDALSYLGIAATVVAVVGAWSSVGVAAALFLGAAFAVTRFEESSSVDLRVVLVAPMLLLLCELVSWSSDAATSSAPRLRTIAAIVVVTGGVTAIVAAVVTLPVGDGAVGLAAAGITAVALVTGALVRSARSVASRS
jgi:hypothetical protein